jgi:hypothetical protein
MKDILEEIISVAQKRWGETETNIEVISRVALAQMTGTGWQVASIHALRCLETQLAYYVTLWRVAAYNGTHAVVQLHGMMVQYDAESDSYIVHSSRKLT